MNDQKKHILKSFILLSFILLIACDSEVKNQKNDDHVILSYSKKEISPFIPISKDLKIDYKLMQIGRRLFNDSILSKDGSMKCSKCHSLDVFGTQHMQFSQGIDGTYSKFNAPTLLNAYFNFRQFWDGRASSLKSQAKDIITDPIYMDMSMKEVVKRVQDDSWYQRQFELALNKKEINEEDILLAIVEYEKVLITKSPYDSFLLGDEKAINENAKKGMLIFDKKGCTNCHMGINLGGTMYQKVGLKKDYVKKHELGIHERDLGLYNRTKRQEDKYFFKVPTLRNIELTSPYFHDGSIDNLTEAVDVMAEYQLGIKLDENERKLILEFLKTLSGTIDKKAYLPLDDMPPNRNYGKKEEDIK